jgi:hypothetical protein
MFVVVGGVIPAWQHSKTWEYATSGFVGTEVRVVFAFLLLGRL